MSTLRTPRRRTAAAMAAGVIALVIALAIAGCGGSSNPTTTTQAFDPAALQQFHDCLAQHGVNGPPGGASPSGAQPPSGQPPSGAIPGGQAPSRKMQRAFEACRQYAPQGAPGAPMAGAPPTSLSQ
jgi:hypothetical protein